ncbi:FkbM family methyltransferase [Altibacter sp. HG106]|uniref:FkbM family methyltransferase n=1 Tax=Altibacter sp. HG106 TaxID=3023937 RepID=UPI00234FCDE9|nr:FkbM family methyltransferase [Altibacter sp. HG106]MDC7995722.1 FkbM family methyltransferase [Altibacter sp. HG106]
MWIICAGGKRSGSTLQYNMVAHLVEQAGVGKRITYFKPEAFPDVIQEHAEYKGMKVIKSHSLTPTLQDQIKKGNAKVVHGYRDVRDVIVSSMNKGWIQENEEHILKATNDYLRTHDQWMSCDATMLSRKYEDFAFQISNELRILADFLGITITPEQYQTIEDSLDVNRLKAQQANIPEEHKTTISHQVFDKETLLHSNHIHDGSTDQFLKHLSNESILLIESLAYSYLLENQYTLYWPKTDSFLSFSQHADDFIAWQLLGKRSKGVVVEVGAFDGVHLSNSYSLEQYGWKAICIEPNPRIFEYLEKQRPNAININKAVVGNPGTQEVTFFDEEIGVLSGVSYDEEDVKRRYANRGLDYKEPNKVTVAASTLGDILSSRRQKHVDILSIDVEGFEVEVLKGLNLDQIRVDLFIIEANTLKERNQIVAFFENYEAYRLVGDNRQNIFFMHKKAMKKKNLKQLTDKGYIAVNQKHPVRDALAIQAVAPEFQPSEAFIKKVNSFSLF